jgi:assimilatory nitrate reductase catalytic subunit
MIYVSLFCDKKPFRFFPIGAKGAIHVPLAIVEDIHPETEIELCVGAPEGLDGLVMVDLGLIEI